MISAASFSAFSGSVPPLQPDPVRVPPAGAPGLVAPGSGAPGSLNPGRIGAPPPPPMPAAPGGSAEPARTLPRGSLLDLSA
jgi:hypothetical protein